MKRAIVALLYCTVLISCGEAPKDVLPDNVLPAEKMVAVLIDIHLVEAHMSRNTFHPDKIAVESPAPNIDVLKKNAITRQQYDESFNYYTQHPKQLVKIYELVLNDFSKMQAEVMNKN